MEDNEVMTQRKGMEDLRKPRRNGHLYETAYVITCMPPTISNSKGKEAHEFAPLL